MEMPFLTTVSSLFHLTKAYLKPKIQVFQDFQMRISEQNPEHLNPDSIWMRFNGSMLQLSAGKASFQSTTLVQVLGKADLVHCNQASWHCSSLARTTAETIPTQHAAANTLTPLATPA